MAKSAKKRGRRRSGAGPQPGRQPRSRPHGTVERERKTARDEKPPAPWGNFPLAELMVLFGIVVLIWGAVTQNPVRIVTGLGVASLAGLELSLREHLAGYRSHTTLLSGVAGVVTFALCVYISGLIVPICLAIAAAVFGIVFFLLRRRFRSASGGYSYRIGGFKG